MKIDVTDEQRRELYEAIRLACFYLAGTLPEVIGTSEGEHLVQQISNFNRLADKLKLTAPGKDCN